MIRKFILFTLAALFIASCEGTVPEPQKPVEEPTEEPKDPIEEPDKPVVENGPAVFTGARMGTWHKMDEIAVIGSGKKIYTGQNSTSTTSRASFPMDGLTIKDGSILELQDKDCPWYTVIFPKSAVSKAETAGHGDVVKGVTLPEKQSLQDYHDANILYSALTNGGENSGFGGDYNGNALEFNSACAVLTIKVQGTTKIKSIEIKAPDGANITGTGSFSCYEGGWYSGRSDMFPDSPEGSFDGSSNVVLEADEPVELAEDKYTTFRACVIPAKTYLSDKSGKPETLRLNTVVGAVAGEYTIKFTDTEGGVTVKRYALEEDTVAGKSTSLGTYEVVETVDWQAAADNAADALLTYYWNSSTNYFNKWPKGSNQNQTHGGYWFQAHAMDAIIDAYLRTGDTKYSDYFSLWFTGVKNTNNYKEPGMYWAQPSYITNSVDTLEWNCITMLRLYQATGDTKYLNQAKIMWGYIKGCWTEEAGGGIHWKMDKSRNLKSACSNGPAGIIAALLYRLDGQKQEYYDWLEKIYEWETETLVNASTGAVNDGYDLSANSLLTTIHSYNNGTYIGMAVELYELSGGKREDCATMAVKAANYFIDNMSPNGIIKQNGTGDGSLFNGIFFRYFADLIQMPKLSTANRNRFEDYLDKNARTLNEQGTNPNNNLFTNNWTVPGIVETAENANPNSELGSHVSGTTLLAAKALIEKDNY